MDTEGFIFQKVCLNVYGLILLRRGLINTIMIKNLLGIIYGMVYGASLIIPGLSGGTFLVIFGCYDKICAAMALDFKMIKKHFVFYMFFGIGAVAGILGFARVITLLFNNYRTATEIALIVLILAGLPFIYKKAFSSDSSDSLQKLKPIYAIPFVLGLGAVIGLSFISGGTATENVILIAVFSFIAAFVMVLPGISGSLMLVVFGVYDVITGALTDFNLSVIVPAVIGILLGTVVGAKTIVFLLGKHKVMAYSAIIGMVVGSVVNIVQSMIGGFV